MVSFRKRGAQPPKGQSSTASKETAVKPKKKGRKKIILAAALLVTAAVIIIAVYFMLPYLQKPICRENWDCDNWSACVNSQQTKTCTDKNHCGTMNSKPLTEQACAAAEPVANEQCKNLGSSCIESECCGSCVHGTCRDGSTFCGDTYCDSGETCSSCPSDCGACAVNGQLDSNILTEPISMTKDEELRKAGYVIIRYYYAQNCEDCRTPVDVESELKEMAAQYKDFVVLITADAIKYSYDSKRYAGVNGVVYKPSIRVDGIAKGQSGYDLLFGYSLVQNLKDGDVIGDVGPLVCKHSDHCEFTGGKIVRTSP